MLLKGKVDALERGGMCGIDLPYVRVKVVFPNASTVPTRLPGTSDYWLCFKLEPADAELFPLNAEVEVELKIKGLEHLD